MALALHAAELLAFWAGAVQQNPVVVQFAQNAAPIQVQVLPEKGLAIATWIGPVISGLLSFFVAWMVFSRQSKKEREQWVRDQKKAEWSRLLEITGRMRIQMRFGSEDQIIRAEIIRTELQPQIRELEAALSCCVFIDRFDEDATGLSAITPFFLLTSKKIDKLNFLFLHSEDLKESTSAQIDTMRRNQLAADKDSIRIITNEIMNEVVGATHLIREEAAKDLQS
jgi:hypothetical protein